MSVSPADGKTFEVGPPRESAGATGEIVADEEEEVDGPRAESS